MAASHLIATGRVLVCCPSPSPSPSPAPSPSKIRYPPLSGLCARTDCRQIGACRWRRLEPFLVGFRPRHSAQLRRIPHVHQEVVVVVVVVRPALFPASPPLPFRLYLFLTSLCLATCHLTSPHLFSSHLASLLRVHLLLCLTGLFLLLCLAVCLPTHTHTPGHTRTYTRSSYSYVHVVVDRCI